MNSIEIKKKVKEFRSEFSIGKVTVAALDDVFTKQGFTIIEYNPFVNDPDVTTVINNLGLEKLITQTNGFIYADSKYRLVFVNEKLNEAERLLVLAHEQGHFYCGHTNTRQIVGHTVTEEYEANEFAHFLLKRGFREKTADIVTKYRKRLIAGAVAVGLAVGGGAASKDYHDRKLYEGEYYVTEHGQKYHRENCVTIEGHRTRRLTKEDVASGEYEPCSVCQPDK